MKRITLLIVFCLFLPFSAYAESFYIEDHSFTAVPSNADSAIRATDEKGLRQCKFIGKNVDLSRGKTRNDFIVTTKDACLWGASAGPIWVLKKLGSSYRVILHLTSYSFDLSNHMTNGLRDIIITDGSAAYARVFVWAFNGTQYKKEHAYFFSADNPTTCKAHPDICPFEF